MRTVNEVSKRTGVSVRTLHHYDAIGLLKPTMVTEAGYRLYDDTALERLQQILLFRELEFPLKEIKTILESPNFDRSKALEQQIVLLTLKKEHLENLIDLARGIKAMGVNKMDFTAFDTSKIDEYAAKAKAAYGQTAEYSEFAEKSKGRTKEETQKLNVQIMEIFAEFGTMRELSPGLDEAQRQVKKLQDFITEHFYTCSDQVLYGLGKMYAGGGDFTVNIDKAGGEGTAEFVFQAIKKYCDK
ncbi:MAG: MerR family transcriptional regulator [Clostridiales bacterium]|jgi:DNA-binding transcriptional MerR regulator|nr:MerR family transcriptional regulator [Clostridiales bacterium]